MTAPKRKKTPRHDHRRSIWILGFAGGLAHLVWCYQCGAYKREGERGWQKPSGIGGANPALKDWKGE